MGVLTNNGMSRHTCRLNYIYGTVIGIIMVISINLMKFVSCYKDVFSTTLNHTENYTSVLKHIIFPSINTWCNLPHWPMLFVRFELHIIDASALLKVQGDSEQITEGLIVWLMRYGYSTLIVHWWLCTFVKWQPATMAARPNITHSTILQCQ